MQLQYMPPFSIIVMHYCSSNIQSSQTAKLFKFDRYANYA